MCPCCALPGLQGDLFLHLMDAAEPEFAQHAGTVPLLQLQSLLESAVRGSSAAADPDAARLAAAFDHRTIINMLVENQKALTAVPGTEAVGRTPFSKVGWRPEGPLGMGASPLVAQTQSETAALIACPAAHLHWVPL